jgi:hypothetical protein
VPLILVYQAKCSGLFFSELRIIPVAVSEVKVGL